jgi:hypothetical protein
MKTFFSDSIGGWVGGMAHIVAYNFGALQNADEIVVALFVAYMSASPVHMLRAILCETDVHMRKA